MKITTEIDLFEIDGEQTKVPIPTLVVKNHELSSRSAIVVISVGGHRYSVEATELRQAIENATNIRRY